MANRYCGNCGNKLGPSDEFCTNCGRPVHRTEAAQPKPPPPTSLNEEQEGGLVESPVERVLGDPLSEISRKYRLYLLIASVVGITIAKTGLVPSEISGLGFGVAFRKAVDLNPLYVIMAAIIAYFVWGYFTYTFSDYAIWSQRIRQARSWIQAAKQRKPELVEEPAGSIEELAPPKSTLAIALNRAAFDFIIPLVAGAYAIYALWSA